MANTEILYTKAGIPESLLFILFGAGFEYTSVQDLANKVDEYYPNVVDINRIVDTYIDDFVSEADLYK